MGACVALQVKGVVESFAAECAEVPLDITVTLHVSVQEPLEAKGLAADPAGESVGVVILKQMAF